MQATVEKSAVEASITRFYVPGANVRCLKACVCKKLLEKLKFSTIKTSLPIGLILAEILSVKNSENWKFFVLTRFLHTW